MKTVSWQTIVLLVTIIAALTTITVLKSLPVEALTAAWGAAVAGITGALGIKRPGDVAPPPESSGLKISLTPKDAS